ncbi:MAG: CoF synthetase [Rhodospirillaceae bacterium]|nr:CoF synthetase [Rhodospirillaceae bacterium]|tara:strand:+ start:530 stop:1927 length:1398 start_codon:yes stop_codon:yes gene_type:complete
MKNPTYFKQLNYEKMITDYPIGDNYENFLLSTSADEIRNIQEKRFLKLIERGWEIPFYQRLWKKSGLEKGDIRSIDDSIKIPSYSKTDLMKSIEDHPPFGDFHGMHSYSKLERPPVVFHTTSGTTGTPQNLFFGPLSRELQNVMLARAYHIQGIGPDDIVHSVYGHGMINGGHYVRETFIHYSPALFLSAGTGNETRSVQQVHNMARFGVTVIVGFADYIVKLAQVAREEGLEPGKDIPVRMIIGHMGRENRDSISELWGGAEIYDLYGVGDTGIVAFEGKDRQGMYVHEDAYFLELVNSETNKTVEDGKEGNMVITVLFKDDIYPVIRFDTNDVTSFETARSELGYNVKRITGFLGRSDNMVKLRGINLYPIAIGAIANEHYAATGEYICKAYRDSDGRDEMVILIEVNCGDSERMKVKNEISSLLKSKLGISLGVELVDKGSTAHLTQVDTRQKAIRLIDERF